MNSTSIFHLSNLIYVGGLLERPVFVFYMILQIELRKEVHTIN